MLLHGIFPAITTPYYSNGKIYLKKLEHNAARYSRGPVAGMVVLGSTGEAVFLTGEEQREVLRAAIGAATESKVMIAGCGQESVHATVELCDFAAAHGYDVAMVRTPHYYRSQMTPPAMLNYFRTVADRSPIPVLIYNFPQCTGYDMPVELIAELAAHRNIIGIKESSGNTEKVVAIVKATAHIRREARVTQEFHAVTGRMITRATAPAGEFVAVGALSAAARPSSSAVETIGTLRTRPKEVGFQTMVGSAHKLHGLLEAGACGGILAFAACAPTACYEIYAAWKDNDQPLAAEKQQRIAAASQRIVGELGIAAVKYACDLNGFAGGPPRLPLLPPTADERSEVEELLEQIKN